VARAILTHTRGWHALAATRSLGRQGIEVYCGEEAPFAPCFFSRYCKGSFQYPSIVDDPGGFLDCLEEKVRELKPTDGQPFVLMPMHKETWLIAQHRERFEPHISFALTSHENMAQTHDKGRLAVLAQQHEILIPQTWQFTSIDDLYRAIPELAFPTFLKMREGAAGVGLKKCDSADDLTSSFKEFVDGYQLQPNQYPLVQQYIDGSDYCVTLLFDQGKCVAKMTYRNVRAFPRGTGAGALRETVRLPDAETAAEQLLSILNWHGMAELDFRKSDDGPPYLIEVNPRFFGGLHQAVAANVDYPHLVFQIASGQPVERSPEVDYSARTEAPVVGLLATLQDMAHDEKVLDRVRDVRDEWRRVGNTDLEEVRLRPFFSALKKVTNPKDIYQYVRGMFDKHRDSIDDIMQRDDPLPVLGVLFPVALMLRHGRLSMGVMTSEAELTDDRPRRRFRDMIRRPRWGAMWLAFGLMALAIFFTSWLPTQSNVGIVLGWPKVVAERWLGENPDRGTLLGATKLTFYYVATFLWVYLLAAILMRQRPKTK
jgi:predicted ATP-grasp superfamily ATP-dependent carboligase